MLSLCRGQELRRGHGTCIVPACRTITTAIPCLVAGIRRQAVSEPNPLTACYVYATAGYIQKNIRRSMTAVYSIGTGCLLYKHTLAIDDIDALFGNLVNLAACKVKDFRFLISCFYIPNCGSVIAVGARCLALVEPYGNRP